MLKRGLFVSKLLTLHAVLLPDNRVDICIRRLSHRRDIHVLLRLASAMVFQNTASAMSIYIGEGNLSFVKHARFFSSLKTLAHDAAAGIMYFGILSIPFHGL